jgi:transcriptional regulator with XRE-family HTH domain
MARPKTDKFTIRDALLRAERILRGGGSTPKDHEIAREAGFARTTYAEFKKGGQGTPRQSPTLSQLEGLSRIFRMPVEFFFDRRKDPFSWQRKDLGMRWRYQLRAATDREQAHRLAADGVARGDAPAEIAERIGKLWASGGYLAGPPDEATLRWMARGGFAMRLVELEPTEHLEELQDLELAKRLREALSKVKPADVEQLRVRVVRNVAHPSFLHDPAAPYLVARLAHRVVADFLRANPSVFNLGIAGGIHVGSFVRTIGAATSPFPDLPGGDKRYMIVPLTMEPLFEHRLWLSDPLAGEMRARTAELLGPDRVRAPSFRAAGFLLDAKNGKLDRESLAHVRELFSDLDLAVFGCGDTADDGWIGHALRKLDLKPTATPETDVCLNLLDRSGEEIALYQNEHRRELAGVRLPDIRRLARRDNKLALLLTSGARKGLPLTLVVRAGCADTIVCDQAAALSALEMLG